MQDSKQKVPYLLEPILNSELTLVNNSKKLEDDPELFNDEHLKEIEKIRKELYDLEYKSKKGEKGLQKRKTELKKRLRDISEETFIPRDMELLMTMALKLVDKLASSSRFSGYTYLDEMKSLAIENIFKYSRNFDSSKISKRTGHYVSAFAYLTQIAFAAFIFIINKYEKEFKARKEYYERYRLHENTGHESIERPEEDYFEDFKWHDIFLPDLRKKGLYKHLKENTIKEPIRFIIPDDYEITEKELHFIEKYEFTLSIMRMSAFYDDK